MQGLDILKNMVDIIGISGYEDKITDYIKESLKSKTDFNSYKDNIGNLIYHKAENQNSRKVAIIAHTDEVGFQVLRIDSGKVYIKAVGNIKTLTSVNRYVISPDGMKKGIISCDDIESLKNYDYEKLYVIPLHGTFEIGDILGFEGEFYEGDDTISGKALDNRISCFIMQRILLENKKYYNDLYFIFSTQEETGMRGARVAITTIEPDLIITLDVSPIGAMNSLELGKGVGIKISDSVGISSPDLVTLCGNIARKNNIQTQKEVSDFGTSELIISNEKDNGAKRIGLSIPCNNMHYPIGMAYKNDLDNCRLLLSSLLNALNEWE